MIDWIFLDVGQVLFHDDQQSFFAYRAFFDEIAALDPSFSFGQMMAEREKLAAVGQTWILHKLASERLGEERVSEIYAETTARLRDRFDAHHLIPDQLAETLAALQKRFRLGIIANQPAECRASLQRRGLTDLFDAMVISEEVDLYKPDPALFRHALELTGADPGRSVMVGDRRDNDIEPARNVGMRTVLLTWASNPWVPNDPLAIQFQESCRRVPAFHSVANVSNEPDESITDLRELGDAVVRISERIAR